MSTASQVTESTPRSRPAIQMVVTLGRALVIGAAALVLAGCANQPGVDCALVASQPGQSQPTPTSTHTPGVDMGKALAGTMTCQAGYPDQASAEYKECMGGVVARTLQLPACDNPAQESPDCVWDATIQGRQGHSLLIWDGLRYDLVAMTRQPSSCPLA